MGRFALLAIVAVAACSAAARADVLFVDDDAPPGGDGSGWGTAHRFLQDALQAADESAGGVTEIRVAQGTYRPDRSEAAPAGSGDRAARFSLVPDVALRGGYAGPGSPDPDARDTGAFESILSGDLAGNDGPGFANNGENSIHITWVAGGTAATTLDGFAISGGNANLSGQGRHGAGLFKSGGSVTVVDCVFHHNAGASDGFNAAAISAAGGSITVSGCTFDTNVSGGHGGAIDLSDCEASLDACHFTNNEAVVGAGVRFDGESLILDGCTFVGNTADVGGGAVFGGGDLLRAIDCVFLANSSGLAIGAVGGNIDRVELVNTIFAQNTTSDIGGGIEVATDTLDIVNCVFSRNLASYGGGLFFSGAATIVDSTIANNSVNGVGVNTTDGSAVLKNVIVWGNGTNFHGGPGGTPPGPITATFSDIEGGWPGAGNIDAEPVFAQPGLDNVRLTFGSPCVDAGDAALLPPDVYDLDGDGDTTEPLPVDADGEPRVQGAAVDMGAYEGEDTLMPPGEGTADLDQGEFALLVPDGGLFNPVESPAVIVMNTSGPDGAWFNATVFSAPQHPGAGGYSDITTITRTETSLDDGQFQAMLYSPFDLDDLGGGDPADVHLTFFDPDVGNWAMAVSGNTAPSDGYPGPIGMRILMLNGGGFGAINQLGWHGVYWDPDIERGFAWSSVDHAADFGVGIALCPADCRQSPDGVVGIRDLLALLAGWGAEGPCDLDDSLAVGVSDLLVLLDIWGPCPPVPAAAGLTSPINVTDHLRSLATWGMRSSAQ